MSQDFTANYNYLARYNQWFNDRLYRACEQLSDEQRKLDRGAFFGSIHNLLNHLVLTDQVWLRRMTEQGVDFAALQGDLLEVPASFRLNDVLYADWAPLVAKRAQLDAAIVAWVASMPQDFPASTLRYRNTAGVAREHPAWQAITHFFNHQTHHRGQVTALLMQAGVDVGVTDLIALAGQV